MGVTRKLCVFLKDCYAYFVEIDLEKYGVGVRNILKAINSIAEQKLQLGLRQSES